jgi:microcystin-dependent protein
MGNHRHSIAHGHGHNITTSDSGHQHPASSPIINNNDQPGYFYTRRGTAGINYDWSSANLVRWDAYQYPGTSSASANVSISGGVSNSADNSGTPIAQTTNNANNSTDGPSTANTANAGGTSGTVVAHNNLQPYIVLNYIIKT